MAARACALASVKARMAKPLRASAYASIWRLCRGGKARTAACLEGSTEAPLACRRLPQRECQDVTRHYAAARETHRPDRRGRPDRRCRSAGAFALLLLGCLARQS